MVFFNWAPFRKVKGVSGPIKVQSAVQKHTNHNPVWEAFWGEVERVCAALLFTLFNE